MLSSLTSLILLTFAYRDFSFMLLAMSTHVFLGLTLSIFLSIKGGNLLPKNQFKIDEIDEEYKLIDKFNINSH